MTTLESQFRSFEIAEGVRNKILILDVERLPGITKQFWWDRKDLQRRYISYDDVERHPRTTIVCAKFYDQPDVIQLAEWDKGGRKVFLKKVHRLLEQADIIVGHNENSPSLVWSHCVVVSVGFRACPDPRGRTRAGGHHRGREHPHRAGP